MSFTEKRNLIYRIIITVLSLISSGIGFFTIKAALAAEKEEGVPNDGMGLMIAFTLFFLISAILYWLLQIKGIKLIQNILLVVNLCFTIASGMSGWPIDLTLLGNSNLFYLSEIVFILTIILGFVYLNLDSFNEPKRVLLFILKFLSTLVAISVAFFVSLFVTIGGNTFLMMNETTRNWALIGVLIWILLNLAYGIFVWTKFFRSWWAWLCSILLVLEVLTYSIYGVILGEVWNSLIVPVIFSILVLGMNYLNNKLS